MVRAILNDSPKPISSFYSPELRQLITRGLLSRNPDQRYDVRQCLRERFIRTAAQRMLGAVSGNESESSIPAVIMMIINN
jgi:hypothetical protein